MLIDDIIQQLKYKIHTMPDDALRAIQDFLFEMRDKLAEVIGDLQGRSAKVDPKMVHELQELRLSLCKLAQCGGELYQDLICETSSSINELGLVSSLRHPVHFVEKGMSR